ncbi:MAG: DedA family protein [Pseudomonadota bacterium]
MTRILDFLQSLQPIEAYALLLGLLASSGFGLPLSEDILILGAAALTLRGIIEPWPLVAVAWCGILMADTLVFHWGKRFGSRLLEHRWLARWITPDRLEVLQQRVRRYGPATLFLVRFMPGFRSPVLLAAGSLQLPYRSLFIWDGLAACVELPLLVWGVRYLGGRWEEILDLAQRFQQVLLPVLVLVLFGVWLWRRARRRDHASRPDW